MKGSMVLLPLSIVVSRSLATFEVANFVPDLSDPNNIGVLHTDAFEKLSNRYERRTPPADKTEIFDAMTDILGEYCPENDETCRTWAQKAMDVAVETVFSSGESTLRANYPKGMDDALMNRLDDVFRTVDDLHERNIDDVIARLTAVKEEIENTDNVHPLFKYLAVAATSTAVESSRLWHSVSFDPDHVLQRFSSIHPSDNKDADRRQLQGIEIGAAIAADVAGFLFLSPGFGLFHVIINLPALIPIIGLLWIPITILTFIPIFLIQAFLSIAFSVVAFVVTLLGLSILFGDRNSNSTETNNTMT